MIGRSLIQKAAPTSLRLRVLGSRCFAQSSGRSGGDQAQPPAQAQPTSKAQQPAQKTKEPQPQAFEAIDTRIKLVQTKKTPKADWRSDPGHKVPYRFRIQPSEPKVKDERGKQAPKAPPPPAQYSDYSGLRFPTLESAENFDYFKDRGLDRIMERTYPIKVPGHRRLTPYLREYIHFLHDLDPARFTINRIAQRYRLKERTVRKVVQEWGANRYLTRSGLTKLKNKLVTRESETLAKKEQQYAKWVGYDQMGDEEDTESDDEALGEFKGWRSTSDWIRRQTVEVDMMSAFPMMEKRDPMPKRVDIDLQVDSRRHHKIINWIDPTDKVVF